MPYYRFNGRAVAWRNNSGLRYLLADHLSFTHTEVQENQAEAGRRRYFPFGSDRPVSGANDLANEERFTSQRRINAGNGNARGPRPHPLIRLPLADGTPLRLPHPPRSLRLRNEASISPGVCARLQI